MTVTELARHVAVSETDLPPGDLPVSLLQQTYLELAEVHVPALDTAGLLQHDSEAGEIRLDTDPTTVRQQLAAVRDQVQTSQA